MAETPLNTLGGAVAAIALGYLMARARQKFFPDPLVAAEQARLAAIHRIIREKGEAAKSMTLGEVAKELRAYGGIWPAMAYYEGNCCMKSGYFTSYVQWNQNMHLQLEKEVWSQILLCPMHMRNQKRQLQHKEARK